MPKLMDTAVMLTLGYANSVKDQEREEWNSLRELCADIRVDITDELLNPSL